MQSLQTFWRICDDLGRCPQYNVNLMKKAGYRNVKEICIFHMCVETITGDKCSKLMMVAVYE